ncbi:MAG: metalloregulator ArsR/SmtB family transcription factor [Myxococcales bacterium]|nr:metalloregulator ArsR/SmtB family transcription factor [Myxococcales bacterium]
MDQVPLTTDGIQKLFKTLADPTRIRILGILAEAELAVHELMEVLGMTQSRVSRHLGILREANLVRDRRDGTFVLYHLEIPAGGSWQTAWDLVRSSLDQDPAAVRDRSALAEVLDARAARTGAFFESVGPEWDALRKVWADDLVRARAVSRLVPKRLRVLDLGTGTGVLALELARLGLSVVGVDESPRMLDAARAKLAAAGVTDVELRLGDASALPFADDELDAAFAHMVLQYLPAPFEALAEMARVTRPGGRVVAVDFASHDREWMREELGVARLGFDADEVASWFNGIGLGSFELERLTPPARGADLPDVWIASGEVA